MPTITYTVRGDAEFAREVARVLGDRRGWLQYGYKFRARPAGAQADLTIRLEPAAAAAKLCGLSDLSCWRPKQSDIVINETNWRTGAKSGLTPERYHNYVICHEVGHALGLAHRPCPAAGGPASVMQQMTKGESAISPCIANDWPVPLVDVLPGRKFVLPASYPLPAARAHARACARGELGEALMRNRAVVIAVAVVLVLVLVIVLVHLTPKSPFVQKSGAGPITLTRHRLQPAYR